MISKEVLIQLLDYVLKDKKWAEMCRLSQEEYGLLKEIIENEK